MKFIKRILEIIVNDILVSAIFGGVIIGSAITMVMNSGATTGGNDIFARIIMKWIKRPYSQLILIVNSIIVLLGVIVFGDFTAAAYSVIVIFTVSKTLEYLMKKSEQNKTVLVFSKQNKKIQDQFMSKGNIPNEMVELVHQDSDGKMILVTKNNQKLNKVENLIYKIDPKAYIITLESNSKLINT